MAFIDGKQIAAAREGYLDAAELDPLGPAGSPPVRPDVLMGWRRSRSWAVDSDRLSPRPIPRFQRDERLWEAADTVLAPGLDGFSDLGVAFVVSDALGGIVGRWAAERPVMRWLDTVHAVEGSSYAEDAVGSNAIGTTLELGRTCYLDGHEHFVADFRGFSCIGVPIRDLMTGRIRGVLDVTTRTGDAGLLLRIVAERLAAAVEARLNEGAAHVERLLLQRFMQARRRAPGVFAINQRTVMSDPRASRLLGHIDQDELWEHAGAALATGQTVAREFAGAGGEFVHTTSVPIYEGSEPIGVLVRVREGGGLSPASGSREPVPAPAVPGLIGHSPRHLDTVSRATGAFLRGPVLLSGAEGVGKLALARAVHRVDGRGELHLLDAAAADVDGFAAWIAELRTILSGTPETVVITHLECLTPSGMTLVQRAVEVASTRGWRIVLTTRADDYRSAAAFARVISVPTLDARTEDIEPLIRHFAHPARVAAEVVQLLRRVRWDGNIRELERVVTGIRGDGSSALITTDDLPPEIRDQAAHRTLTRLERVEIREMLHALSEFDGNRQHAAESLGVSRSTLYRRLRDAGIELDKTTF